MTALPVRRTPGHARDLQEPCDAAARLCDPPSLVVSRPPQIYRSEEFLAVQCSHRSLPGRRLGRGLLFE
jgi:hypothetical protein